MLNSQSIEKILTLHHQMKSEEEETSCRAKIIIEHNS
jgi:hypothetical protein